MIRKVLLNVLSLFVFVSAWGNSNSIDSTVFNYAKTFPDSTQISVGIIVNGEVEYHGFIKTNGAFHSIENEKNVFEIGSISKVFTENMLAYFLHESNIDIDTPIEKLTDFPLHSNDFPSSEITLKNLSNHTSGLPPFPINFIQYFNYQSPIVKYDQAVLEEYLEKQLGLSGKAGEKYGYSNFGFAILGYLIEKMEEADYETLLQEHICSKYDLTSTTTKQDRIANQLVEGRNAGGQTVVNKSWGVFKASGGICSNMVDLCQYVQANFTNDPVLALQRQKTFDSEYGGMAMAWHMRDVGRTCQWYNHNGGMEGYRSSLNLDVESKTAAVVLSNVSVYHADNNKIDELTYELMKMAYLKNAESKCKNAFLDGALKEGWGSSKTEETIESENDENSLVGVWTRENEKRTITRSFTKDFKVQCDFYLDNEIDVWGYYSLENDQIVFKDVGGAACGSDGTYQFDVVGDTLQFKVLEDNCEGRKTDLQNLWYRRKK